MTHTPPQEDPQGMTQEDLEEHIGAAEQLHRDLSARLEATARD
ncbi:hypothetical protein [Nesterenkonia sp. HG001]|nr:hypothetical protein [Nesterenkonia sp. HG001]MDZ5079125.1 hypothetical protein [Nesterenkonia sp. HG001]